MLRQRLSVLSTSIIRSSNHSKPILRYPSIQSHPFQLRHSPSAYRIISPNAFLDFQGFRAYSLPSLNDLRDKVPRNSRRGRGVGLGLERARLQGGVTRVREPEKPIGLGKIAKFINAGKIDSSELITMKILKDAGVLGKQMKDGVRLMGRGSEQIKWPIHQEVSRVTVRAKEAVEAAGGSVRRVYYNKLGLKALVKPECFEKKGRLLPRAARPPPKQKDKVDSIGRLPAPTKPIPFLVEASKDLPVQHLS
ncbi:54S ribosomal protein L10, mitochondrial [Glycine soja]|uniref:54S ribosomal protein L10, mitochondrial n=1 Tax=Glycine soja TaxID=3848 RepID=A0A445GXW7_GLYSO|nr:54S ribosomal protein L10, mitochondrial [Glycine soja]